VMSTATYTTSMLTGCGCEHAAPAHPDYADDTSRTDATFSYGYIPELIEDQRARMRLFDMRMADSMIQYEEMRDSLRGLDDAHHAELQASFLQHLEGECCVCLDDLGSIANVTTTTCGHVYHTKCLVETLAEGTVTSCPMCRTDIKELASKDLSGKVFRFMCVFRINADTVQSCMRTLKQEIECVVDSCEHEARSLQTWRLMSSLQTERRSLLKSRLLHQRTRLQLLEQFSQANLEGFEDICKHVAAVLGEELGECARECRMRLDCFRDQGVTGDFMRLAQRLSTVLKLKIVGIDQSAVALHEKKLREARGLFARPSWSEAHFAMCSSGEEWAEREHVKMGGCFVAFRRPSVVV